jgi:hypothetical protein
VIAIGAAVGFGLGALADLIVFSSGPEPFLAGGGSDSGRLCCRRADAQPREVAGCGFRICTSTRGLRTQAGRGHCSGHAGRSPLASAGSVGFTRTFLVRIVAAGYFAAASALALSIGSVIRLLRARETVSRIAVQRLQKVCGFR